MADKPPAPIYRSQGNSLFRTDAGSVIIKRGQEVPYNVNGAPTGAVVADGDYGDITVTSGVWSIDPTILSAFGRNLIDDADATAARTTLGLGYFATGTDAANLTGTVAAGRLPQFTGGDVTTSGAGSVSLAIGANKVTFAKFVAATAAGFVGATGAGNFAQLTGTQATTLLDSFTSLLKGLVPASGGGTVNFLRADGTWAAPTASVAWGGIGGSLSAQTDLQTALDGKLSITDDTANWGAGYWRADGISGLTIGDNATEASATIYKGTVTNTGGLEFDLPLFAGGWTIGGDGANHVLLATYGSYTNFTFAVRPTVGSDGIYHAGDFTLDTDTTLAANSDTKLATQKATKTYADTKATSGAITGSGLTMTTARLLGRTTAATGAVEELTAASAKAFLAITASDVSGLAATATSTDAANLTGTLPAARIADGSLSLAKTANIANSTILGNNSGAPGPPLALTIAQAKTLLAITESDVANLTTDLAAKAPLASPQFTGVAFYQQSAPTAKNATATLTIADLLTLIITATSTTAVSLTLPTGTLTDAGILGGALANNEAFEWYLINLGSSSGAVTILAGTSHTIVGNAVVAISTSARFLTRKTATNTFITYRIA